MGGTPTEAAMKGILPALTGIMLCAATTHSNAADSAPLQYETGKEMHAAVTDTPEIVDMSHADPKTWHRLPPATQVYDQALSQKMELPVQFSSRPRPF
jgi:hypothetical protein